MAINTDPHIHKLVMCSNMFVRGSDGKFLMLKRSPLKKYAPNVIHSVGGKIDTDEDPLKAAVRELWEEAGITVKNIKVEAIITELKPFPDKEESWLIFYFSGDYESGEVKETEEGELIWLTKQEIFESPLFPSLRQVIGNILNEKDGCVFATFKYIGEVHEGNIETVSRYTCIV